MVRPLHSEQPVADLELDDLSQEIDEPFGDFAAGPNEPTLTKIDFDEIDVDL